MTPPVLPLPLVVDSGDPAVEQAQSNTINALIAAIESGNADLDLPALLVVDPTTSQHEQDQTVAINKLILILNAALVSPKLAIPFTPSV